MTAIKPPLQKLIHKFPIVDNKRLLAGLSVYPTTPGQHVVILKDDNLFRSDSDDYVAVLSLVRKYADVVKRFAKVQRCGLAYDGHRLIQIIPMHGLSEEWVPIKAEEVTTNNSYPGYLWTKSSPQIPDATLDDLQHKLMAWSKWQQADYTFLGEATDTNLFARLLRGEIPQWRFWEDSKHVAFLTPFGNTPGYSVVIPRTHLPSDILGLNCKDFDDFMLAIQKAASVLAPAFKTMRVGLFFEGFEIDYAHAKLVPVLDGQASTEGPSDEYHETYPGFLSTRLGPQCDTATLNDTYREFKTFFNSQTTSEARRD